MTTDDQKNPQYESALSWWESGDYEYAITLMKSVRESGFIGDSASTIGGWLHQLGRLEEAKHYFQIALEDEDETAATGIGGVCWELGLLDEAEKYLRLAIQSDYSANSLAALADFLMEKGSDESRLEAEVLLRVVFQELNSDHQYSLCVWAGFNLGVLLHERQEYREAETLYRQVMISGYGAAYVNLGCLLHEKGNCSEGDALWVKLIEEIEEEEKSFISDLASENLGLCLASQGRKEESTRYTAALEVKQGTQITFKHITGTVHSNPWGF